MSAAIVGDLQRMGLTFEDIVADADKLATSLKELDQVQIKGLDSGLGGVNTKLGQIDESARSSGSVMANMVGNATQDLGALGGVAGSAGVAIGQMGEYMTEALSSGEKLGCVMANFGKVAGPMAAIALGVQLLSGFMERAKKNQEELAEATKEVVAALLEAQDAGTGAIESLEGLGDEKVIEVLEKLSDTNFDEFDAAARKLGLDYADLVEGFRDGDGALVDTLDTYDQLFKRWEELVVLTGSNSKAWAALADETGRDRGELQSWMAAAGEVDRAMGDQLDTQGKALDKGDRIVQMRQEYSDAEREAAAATEESTKASEEGEAAIAAYKDAVEQSKQVVLDYAAAIEDAALNIAAADAEMRDLAGTFTQIGTRGDAFRRIFDLQNAPLDAEAAVRDIELAIDDLSTAAEGIDLSEGLDPSNVNADALLDAIDGLRPQIQQKVTDAFSAGGPEAAKTLANSYVAQVAKELEISEVDAAELLGIENIEALVTVAIEQTSLANAQSQLAILTGLDRRDTLDGVDRPRPRDRGDHPAAGSDSGPGPVGGSGGGHPRRARGEDDQATAEGGVQGGRHRPRHADRAAAQGGAHRVERRLHRDRGRPRRQGLAHDRSPRQAGAGRRDGGGCPVHPRHGVLGRSRLGRGVRHPDGRGCDPDGRRIVVGAPRRSRPIPAADCEQLRGPLPRPRWGGRRHLRSDAGRRRGEPAGRQAATPQPVAGDGVVAPPTGPGLISGRRPPR